MNAVYLLKLYLGTCALVHGAGFRAWEIALRIFHRESHLEGTL
jgi:hypothetical protein